MPQIRCPKCQTLLQVASSAGGKLVKCPKCATILRLGGDPAPAKEGIAPRPRAVPAEKAVRAADRAERAKRRPERSDDDGERPRHRSGDGRQRRRSTAPIKAVLLGGVGCGLLFLACAGIAAVALWPRGESAPVAQAPPAPLALDRPGPHDPPAPPVPQPGEGDRRVAPADPGAEIGAVPDIPPLPPPEARPVLVLDPGGHTGTVKKVLFTPDARQVVSVSLDKSVRVWDVVTGESLRTFRLAVGPGDEGSHSAAALSPDGKWLALSGTPVGRGKLGVPVHVLALEDGHVETVLTGHTNVVTSLAFSPDNGLLATAGLDGTVRVYSTANWQLRVALKEHPKGINCVAFDPRGTRLATAGRDNQVFVWDLRVKSLPRVLAGHTQHCNAVAWAPDGHGLASGSGDGTIRIWGEDGKAGRTYELNKGGILTQITALAYTPDGKRLLYTGIDRSGAAGMLDLADGKRREFAGHSNTVQHGSLSSDGRLAVTTGGDDHETFVWRTEDAAVVQKFQGGGRSAWGVGWGADGKSIAWGNTNRAGTFLAEPPLERAFALDTLETRPAAGGNFQRCVLKGEGYTLAPLRDLVSILVSREGKEPVVLRTPRKGERIYSASLLPGERVVLGGSEGMYLVDLRTGKVTREFKGHSGIVLGVSPSPDNKYFVTGSTDETLRVWSPERDEPLLSIFVVGEDWIAWTPEGYYAASPYGERLMGWQVNNGQDKPADYFPAIQFRASLYQPDVIRLLLPAGGLPNAIAQASKLRKRPIGAVVLTQVLPPEVKITAPDAPPGGLRVKGAVVEVKAAATSRGAHPVTALRLLLDGRPYQGQKGVRGVQNPRLGAVSASWSVAMPAGRHVLTVQAESAVSKGLSAPVEVVADDAGLPSLYMVAIGVSAYPGQLRLRYAASDAELMAKTFRERSAGVFKKVDVHVVTDRDATRKRIASELEWLGSVMTAQDVGVVSFSGHGARDDDGNFYLVPVDCRGGDVNTLFPGDLLKEHLANMPGRIIAMLDACHSGTVAEDIQVSRPDNLVRDLVTDDYGVVVMCSSQGREYSMESPATRAGFFTLGVTEGLSGKADFNHDGIVYIHELDAYAAARVRQLSRGEQHPVTGRPPTIRSFPLARP
jgi:WD40 repeat protein